MIMKEMQYFDAILGSRRKRRTALKAVIALLVDIRNAESKSLRNTPENFRGSDSFEAGEFAVDALDEAIAILADIY
jgi:hypothetical protein